MTSAPVQLTRDEGVATILLDRPQARNALDRATKEALLAALADVHDDPDARCLVLTGSGPAFCAGQDLKEHLAGLEAGDLDALWSTVPEHYVPIASALAALDLPVVAAVNGVAAGAGMALALLADYRVLAASAGFDTAFARIGLSCDTGTSWTLPRLVGPARALDLLMRPRTVSAAEALTLGLATEVVADDGFRQRVTELARTLAAGPTLAFAGIRQSVAYAAGHTLAESLDHEGELVRRTGASADHANAVAAFVARRPPEFTGR